MVIQALATPDFADLLRDVYETQHPPIIVDGASYAGRTVHMRVTDIHYQTASHVSGYIAPTVGLVSRGSGAMFGAGGSIGSVVEEFCRVVGLGPGGG